MQKAILAILALIFAAGFLTYTRIATVSSDPEVWHVDPIDAPGCSSPNCYFMAPEGTEGKPLDAIAPIYGQGAYEMAEAFHQYAQAQRDTEHLSGITAGLHLTYVQRTARLRFPDYISVKFIDLPEKRSTIAIFSRARFGHGDLGVNAARVKAWIKGMESFEITPPRYLDEG